MPATRQRAQQAPTSPNGHVSLGIGFFSHDAHGWINVRLVTHFHGIPAIAMQYLCLDIAL